MAVVYYQLSIIGTILAAYLASERVREWLRRDELTPIGAAVIVAGAWSLFTLTHVFMLELMLVQFLTIWGTVGVLRYLRGQRDEIARMRHALADSEPRVVERVVEIARSRPLQTVVGRAHARELRRALEGARESLVILSGWASDYVIDDNFRRCLGHALARGVHVYIGYGWSSPSRPSEPSLPEQRAVRALLAVADEAARVGAGRLHLAKWPNHAKMLICDDRYAICGSHNWLSNRGFTNDERSWIVVDPEFVRAERDEVIARMRGAGGARAAS